MLDNVLDGDDGIRAVGDDAAGRDGHRLARAECARSRPPGGDVLDDGQRSGHVGDANDESVHRRARERRQVDDGADVLRRHAAGGTLDRHDLGGSARTCASTFACASSNVRSSGTLRCRRAVRSTSAWTRARRSRRGGTAVVAGCVGGGACVRVDLPPVEVAVVPAGVVSVVGRGRRRAVRAAVLILPVPLRPDRIGRGGGNGTSGPLPTAVSMYRCQIVAGNVGPETAMPCTSSIGISPFG